MLDGDDSDAGLVVALGGPAGQELIDLGIPSNQSYWLRVWAARGLFWAWEDQALPFLTDSTTIDDERARLPELPADGYPLRFHGPAPSNGPYPRYRQRAAGLAELLNGSAHRRPCVSWRDGSPV
jgi:hypothetical protein